MKDIIFELKKKLTELVKRSRATGLLFSGGLDTAILASINPSIKAITVNLKSQGEDVKYSASVAKFFNIEHYQKSVDIDEAIESIPEVITILKTFDPAIPNDVVVYFGLKQAKDIGIKEVMTGDGSDELFAGYNFMQQKDDLEAYIKKITRRMEFSSNDIGRFFKVKIIQPFLDKEFIDFSLKISPSLKIKKQNGKLWGKWILRKAFEDILPKEVIWQDKRPLEYGSGMTKIREIIGSKIGDEEFKKVTKSSSIKFVNKEHFYYYKIYMEKIGQIPSPKNDEKACPNCGAAMDINAFHCNVCGYILDWRL